jgi:hypothetical protein
VGGEGSGEGGVVVLILRDGATFIINVDRICIVNIDRILGSVMVFGESV